MKDFSIWETEVKVYYEPFTGEFNMYPFQDGVSSMDDIDTSEVLDEYMQRFKDAWEELAEK